MPILSFTQNENVPLSFRMMRYNVFPFRHYVMQVYFTYIVCVACVCVCVCVCMCVCVLDHRHSLLSSENSDGSIIVGPSYLKFM